MINARKCSKFIHIYVYGQSCFVHSSLNFSNWNMTIKETVATTWKINEIQFRQLFLNPWHMLSSIWVLLGLWLVIYTVKIQFSFIFPASAWSPFLSVNLTDKLARLLCTKRHTENAIDTPLQCTYCTQIGWKYKQVYTSPQWRAQIGWLETETEGGWRGWRQTSAKDFLLTLDDADHDDDQPGPYIILVLFSPETHSFG